MAKDTLTITDNRTGEAVEVPITNGGVDAAEWRKLLPGIWFLDPAFGTTASTESAITYLDGGNGVGDGCVSKAQGLRKD